MLEWMILPFKRYAEFAGRSRRKEFWAFALLNVLVYIAIGIIAAATGTSVTNMATGPNNFYAMYSVFFSGFGVLFSVWWLAVVIPSIAVSVRRLHDCNLSGWWYLGFVVASFIPLLNFIALIAFFVIMLLPGTPAPNRYGSDPKEPAGSEVLS